MIYDAIIIGKGPAGMSASLYTVRANLKTLLIGKSDSALAKAGRIENYFGFSEPIKGETLLQEGEKQVLRLGVEIVEDEVISIEKTDSFEVMTSKGRYEGKTVLLATGLSRKKPSIMNLENFEGKGVSYCSSCDGFFYNNMKVGVLGFKDYAVHEALELETFTDKITIYTNGMDPEFTGDFLEKSTRFDINMKPVKKVDGAEFLQRIYFKDGSSEEIDGLFIAYDSASSTDFALKLGVLTEDNSIVVDKYQQTNLEGLFAAGDCTGGFRQVSTAVGQGAMAGRKMAEYLRNLRNKERS